MRIEFKERGKGHFKAPIEDKFDAGDVIELVYGPKSVLCRVVVNHGRTGLCSRCPIKSLLGNTDDHHCHALLELSVDCMGIPCSSVFLKTEHCGNGFEVIYESLDNLLEDL